MKKALIISNLQNDYCDDGSIGVYGARDIVPIINRIRDAFDYVVFVLDWHPKNHISFINHGGHQPAHCIANTTGAELNPGLLVMPRDLVIKKGTLVMFDSNSAFYDAQTTRKKTNLDAMLKHHSIKELYLVGAILERDILATCIDARLNKYSVNIIEDAVLGCDKNSIKKTISTLLGLDIGFVNSSNFCVRSNTPSSEDTYCAT